MKRGSKANRLFDFWVGIPILNLLATFRRRRPWPPSAIKRVGVMCSPALGDTLLFSAAAQDVRAHFGPSVEIVHFCMKQNLAAAELIPGIDRRVVISLTKIGETVRAMRAERLDVLLDFTAWQRLTALYSLTARAGVTVGFRTSGQHRGRGYDLAVEHRNDRHEVENFRALVLAAGLHAGSEPVLSIPDVDAEPLADEGDIVVFHPWASGQKSWLREWPEERWIELARLIGRPGTVFAVTGAPSDLERCEPFVAWLKAGGLNATAYVSPDGFRSLSHLLMRARVVVSVNTGVMHLAAVLGAPTVSLNGPTNPVRWGARGRRVANVQPADGSGGYLNLGFEFAGNSEDVMSRIAVDDVVKAVDRVIAPQQ